MGPILAFASTATMLLSMPAAAMPSAASQALQAFSVSPVSDDVLSASAATGPRGRYGFADDVAANLDRQAASLRSATIVTWSIEFASPLIAANAARAGLLD